MTTTTKFFAQNANHGGLPKIIECHETWLEAAKECMQYDGYAWQCRELKEDDLPVSYEVYDSEGVCMQRAHDLDSATEDAEALSAEGDVHSVKTVIDESRHKVGEFGLWVKSSHHGNNVYCPEGIKHKDFAHVSGESVEDSLRQYTKLGGTGYTHPRYPMLVQEATFDDADNLIKVDGEPVKA